jgi:hypothetical protein
MEHPSSDTEVMQAAVKGGRVALATLDSGANAPFLFNHAAHLASGLPRAPQAHAFGADGVKRVFSIFGPATVVP